MLFTIYKMRMKKVWKEVGKSDRKIKDKEIKPEGIIKKDFEIPLKDTRYKTKFKSKSLQFNLYYDKEEKTRPVILDIHGGAWIYGDKDLNDNFCYHLAKEGFNVISLSYTLGFKAKNINQIQEIHFLMNYLYENKDRYHLDFENLFVTGDSAGGQLTFLYALIISNNDLFKDIFKCYNYNNLKINAIAVNHGAPYLKFDKLPPNCSNFTARLSYTSRLKTAYGHFYKFKKVYRATDPNETLRAITHFVPTIILSSRGDSLSYQSSLLDEEMTRCRFDHTYYFYNDESKGHVFNVLFPQSEEGKEFNSQIINYFRTYIK